MWQKHAFTLRKRFFWPVLRIPTMTPFPLKINTSCLNVNSYSKHTVLVHRLVAATLFLHDVKCLVGGGQLLVWGDRRAEALSLGHSACITNFENPISTCTAIIRSEPWIIHKVELTLADASPISFTTAAILSLAPSAVLWRQSKCGWWWQNLIIRRPFLHVSLSNSWSIYQTKRIIYKSGWLTAACMAVLSLQLSWWLSEERARSR